MFGSLIRRKPAMTLDQGDPAFESTTFSLSTTVPRPTERRGDDRVLPTLCIVKLVGPNGDQLMRARNVSAGGMMCEVGRPVSIGDKVELEFNSQKIPSTVIWIRDTTAGFKFDADIDLGEMLAGRKPRHGAQAHVDVVHDLGVAADHQAAKLGIRSSGLGEQPDLRVTPQVHGLL